MAPGQTRNIRVEGQAAEIGQLVNCVTVDYDLAACLTLNVVQPELALDIEAPLTVLKCEPIIMRYTVTNNGTGVAQNVRVNHDLPEGLLTDTGQTKVTTPAVQLQPGESRAFEIQLAASQSGEYENMARATGAGNLSAEDTAPTTVVAPELEITKTGPSEVYLGRNVTYEIVVTNVGDGEARDAVLTDAIPTGVDVVSSTPAATMVEGQATWNLGTLAPEESRTVSITLDPNVRPTLDNEATVTAYCAAAASATASTEVERIAAVLLEVIDEDDPVEVGATTTYVITVTNQGSATGENIKIACELEEQMRFVAEGSGGATEVASSEDGIVEFRPLAELGAGERATWRVVIEAASAGDVRFKVAMTEDRLERPVFETEATNFYE